MGNRWVWITRPDSYLDADGKEHGALDPSGTSPGDGWWTCHPDTQPGDLVMLYRTGPRSDIAYLLQVSSDPWTLGTRRTDGVATFATFDRMIDDAASVGAVSDADASAYRETRLRVAPIRMIVKRHGWRIDRPDLARTAHDKEGAALAERERTEGYSDALQADYDTWWTAERDLEVLQAADIAETALMVALGTIRADVFRTAGWLEDTLLEDEHEFAGRDVCSWKPLDRFSNPLRVSDLRADEWLTEKWNALRANFNGSYFVFDDDVWTYVVDLAVRSGNDGIAAYSTP